MHAVDPNQPVENIQTLDDLRAEALAAPRLTATLLSVFAGLALLVTLAGIGGVIATSVTQRTREFGVRMALGASRGAVMAMVLRQGLTLVGIGLVLGIAAAAVGGRVLSAYLYQTTPRDPLIVGVVAFAFLAAAALACLAPARRATTVDSADRAADGVARASCRLTRRLRRKPSSGYHAPCVDDSRR